MLSSQKQAERLKQLIGELHMTPAELSRKTGIPKSSISNYLNAKSGMSRARSNLLGEFFDVAPEWLLGGDVPQKPVYQDTYLPREQEADSHPLLRDRLDHASYGQRNLHDSKLPDGMDRSGSDRDSRGFLLSAEEQTLVLHYRAAAENLRQAAQDILRPSGASDSSRK